MLYRLYLTSFLIVYRTGSQTRAAEELHLTQPAISQHIKQLEKHIGKSLFIKEGKRLIPTIAAHQLALRAGIHIDALDEIWAEYKPQSSALGGNVYVGGIAEFFAKVFAPHLSALNPYNIQIHFTIGHDNLVEKLLHNELDLAQLCAHAAQPGITVEPLYQETFVLVGQSAWLKHSSIKALRKGDTSALDDLPWVAYDESLLFIKEYYHAVFNRSFAGKVNLFIKDLWAIQEAVMGGIGVTVLPFYFCHQYLQLGKLVLLYQPIVPPELTFYLAWRDGALRNQGIAIVHKLLKQFAAKNREQDIALLNKLAKSVR